MDRVWKAFNKKWDSQVLKMIGSCQVRRKPIPGRGDSLEKGEEPHECLGNYKCHSVAGV